jgi:hypothetical protein
MPSRGSAEVGQRRFWNTLKDVPGLMFVGAWSYAPEAVLYSNTGFSAPLTIFENGPITFPPEHKLARTWGLHYEKWVPTLGSVDFDGTNEWIFKPFSTKWDLVGPNAWMRGDDWDTANLFYDSSPFAIPTTLKYTASGDTPKGPQDPIAPPWAYNPETGAQGWGNGGRLYGYDNDVYFGNNEMGGSKPNVGVGPQMFAIGDLSKSFSGLWGALGISHGVCINSTPPGCMTIADWVFDLCYRPQMAAMASFNNELYHLNEDPLPTEGWGTMVVAIIDATVEFMNGVQEVYRQFTVDVSPSRETINVYTMKGQQLTYGIDYIHDDCDRSGRSYRLLEWLEDGSRNLVTNPIDPCETIFALVVTFLVTAATLRSPRRDGRQTDTNEGHDRLRIGDIRGL